MPFSVRVHPAPFSPTPNRHAGIGLKMKGGGPGGSRLGQKSLASSIPGWRGARGAGLQKEVCSLTHPPLQAQAVVVVLRLALATKKAHPRPKGRDAAPLVHPVASSLSFGASTSSSSRFLQPCRHRPHLQLLALAVALRLAGGSREGDPTPQGAGAIPLCPRTSSITSAPSSIRCVEFLRFIIIRLP